MPKKKRNDGIDSILRGWSDPPVVPPQEEEVRLAEEASKVSNTDNFSTKYGLSNYGTPPDSKTPPSPDLGEVETKYRSGGKGGQGLPHDEKIALSRAAFLLRRVLEPHECQDIARRTIEWGEKERERMEKRYGSLKKARHNYYYSFYGGTPWDRAAYFAKELRTL